MQNPCDWDLLAILINQARGKFTFNRFARECGVDAGYLSKITNHKLQNPPQPEILRKIAVNSQNSDVTYKTLMDACGYLAGFDEEKIQVVMEDELIGWAIDPENRDFIKFMHEYYKMGITKEALKHATLTINKALDGSR